jgi:transglutaminase-like putative cysteine protease
MKLRVSSDLHYSFLPETGAVVSVHAATSPDQTVLSESLVIDPLPKLVLDPADARGERRFRAQLSGDVRIRYEAIVDNGARSLLPPGAIRHAWTDLPVEALLFLLPSRYCSSDRFISFAESTFGAIPEGGAMVQAVLGWLYENIEYAFGFSSSDTTAEHTFVERKGVCRDFTHLGITICRALNIPARAVSAYAMGLKPQDFHAVFEVYLGHAWWLVDPTGLVPVENLVRIGVGRDAADIAFLSTSSPCRLIWQTVDVSPVV